VPDLSIRVSKKLDNQDFPSLLSFHSITAFSHFHANLLRLHRLARFAPLLPRSEATFGTPGLVHVCRGRPWAVSNPGATPYSPSLLQSLMGAHLIRRDRIVGSSDPCCLIRRVRDNITLFSANHRAGALSNNFPSVKLNEHCRICLEILDGNGESEVV
jgi:hypothetical protein